MDLETLELQDAADLELVSPVTGRPLGMWVRVFSKDSERGRRAIERLANRRIQAETHRGRNVRREVNLDEHEEGRAEVIAACTEKWWEITEAEDGSELRVDHWTIAGQPFPCTVQNARRLFADPHFTWMLDQVDLFAATRSGFAKPSSPAL
jgi:hypothetical protein